MYTLMLSRSVIISEKRTHSLHDSICRKVEEGLQLIVDSENEYVDFPIACKYYVQYRD